MPTRNTRETSAFTGGFFPAPRARRRFHHHCRGLAGALLVLALAESAMPVSRAARLEVGKPPPSVVLEHRDGGRLNGQPWRSSEIRKRITVLFYVDPDEKDLNESVADAIKKEKFPDSFFQSIAIINMAATWKPNWIITAILKHKQKKFPRTIYVRDNHKVLVRKWGLEDNNYVICAFDEKGRLLFRNAGKFSARDTRKLVEILRRGVTRLGQNSSGVAAASPDH